MFFVRMLGLELAGSSPEPLVRVEGRTVTSRPIAGTRPRGETELRRPSVRARAPRRPQGARRARDARRPRPQRPRPRLHPGTVRPSELLSVERFSKVMHIVSTVEGELAEGTHPLDALAVTFPAGTVTGAPKRRAMELIAELEPTARGPYAGAVGYCTFAGDLDFCITIRTAVVADGDGVRPDGCRGRRGLRPRRRARRDQREGRGPAARDRRALRHPAPRRARDPRRRPLRLVHLQPRAAARDPGERRPRS